MERRVLDSSPVRVEYGLTQKGQALEPAIRELKEWASVWVERVSSAEAQ